MDEIALLRSLAPPAESPDAARAAALQALEANFDQAPVVPAPPPVRSRRRGVLALAGAGAVAAIVAGILVVSSGPSAETAVAQVLRETAVVAAADTPESLPGPGRFLYMRSKRAELQEWVPGGYTASFGGVIPRAKGAFNALNTWQEEEWWSPDGPSRSRWVLATPEFLSAAEERRWEREGSPLPGSFGEDGVSDVENEEGPRFPDYSALPTEPRALRLAIERRQAEPINPGRTIAELWDILDKPNTTPELRAAIFEALAELPGIELDRDVVDLVGRPGYALSYEGTSAGSYGEQQPGKRVEYIFDPGTSEVLGRREVISDPAKLLPWAQGIPAGTAWREVAYLRSEVVDSTRERPPL